jgi:hypothetical protein
LTGKENSFNGGSSQQAKTLTEDLALLHARYHLFIKTLEGGYVSFYPKKRLFLENNNGVIVVSEEYPAFECAVCQNCGQLYIVATLLKKS